MAVVVSVQVLLPIAFLMALSYGETHVLKNVDEKFQDIFKNDVFRVEHLSMNEVLEYLSNRNICPTGYDFDVKLISCKPLCVDGCENGRCIAPDKCKCESGYEFVLNKCIPICSNGCQNGYCIGPDRCQCFFGWDWNNISRTCDRTIRVPHRLGKRGIYGAEFLYVQPWSKSTKPPIKKVTKTAKPTKKFLTLTIE